MSNIKPPGKDGFAYLIVLVIVAVAFFAFALYRDNFIKEPKVISPVVVNANLLPTPAPSTKIVGLFADSTGQEKYLIQVTLSNDSQIFKNYLYLSTDKDYTKGKRILYASKSQSVVRSSENQGTKYIVVELDGPGENTDFALFDENGTKINIDLTAIDIGKDSTRTKIKFGQWQDDVPTNFSLIFTTSGGSHSEAIFDAATGHQVKSNT